MHLSFSDFLLLVIVYPKVFVQNLLQSWQMHVDKRCILANGDRQRPKKYIYFSSRHVEVLQLYVFQQIIIEKVKEPSCEVFGGVKSCTSFAVVWM